MTDPASDPEAPPEMRCDFCGKRVERVRRIALDRDYERLQTPHEVQYACPTCSEAKEQQRSTSGAP